MRLKPSFRAVYILALLFPALVAPQAVDAAMAETNDLIVARPGADTIMGLDDCVAAALDANAVLGAERLRMSELRGQMNQARATGLPTLDLSGSWTRSRDPSFALDSTFGGGGGGDLFSAPAGTPGWFLDWASGLGSFIPAPEDIPAQSFVNARADVNWTLNPWKIRGALGAAHLGIDRQRLLITEAQNRMVEQVIAAYYGIVQAADKVDAVRAQIADQAELLGTLRLQRELGLATRLDTLQASVGLANLRPQLTVAEAGLRNAGANLNAVMGRAPEAALSIRNEGSVELDPIDEGAALQLAVERPDLQAQEHLTDILRRNQQAQAADNRPYLTVGGAYGYVGTQADNLFDEGHDSWRATVALNWSPFDGLLTRGRVAETRAQIRRSEVELDGNRRTAQVEVLQVLANLEMARELLAAVQMNLERAEETLEETMMMLELGKASYLDVLVAESNRAQALGQVIDARYQVFTLTASLKRALGRSPRVALVEIPGLVAEVDR